MLANREKSISHLQELNKKHGQRILKALNERKEHINISEIDLSARLEALVTGEIILTIPTIKDYKTRFEFGINLQDIISEEMDALMCECDYMEGLASELLAYDLGYKTGLEEVYQLIQDMRDKGRIECTTGNEILRTLRVM